VALTRRLVVGLTALVLAACTTTASPSPSAVPSTVASQTAAVCNPAAPPTLIGPDGTQVVLGDGPGGTSAWVNEKGMAFYLRQIGDCIWIIGYEPASDGGQAQGIR